MNKVASFLRLVRWPNLVFIALTQVLFYFCILVPLFAQAGQQPVLTFSNLFVIVLASVFIAAGGYIINDYFDINIDQINKPERLIIGKVVSRRWAILWHTVFSLIGVAISFYAGWKLGVWWVGPANFFCTFLLFVYSTTFKKKFLSGNIIISVLTAWTVAILGLVSFYKVFYASEQLAVVSTAKLLRFTILYAGFAFIISLIREAVKDMEDMGGDARYGCKTLPIVAGVNAAKIYTGVWLSVLTIALVVIQFYALQFNWWWLVLYSTLFIIVPLVYLSLQLMKASSAKGFHRLSSISKLIMLTGILSMIFFMLYL